MAHGTSVQQVCLNGGTIVCPQVALEGGTIHQDCIGKVRRCARTANPNDNIHADCRGVTKVLAEAAAESGECTDVANDGRRCVSAETCETQVNDDNERVRVCRQCTTTTRPIAEGTSNNDDGDDDDDDTEGDSIQSGSGGGSGSIQ